MENIDAMLLDSIIPEKVADFTFKRMIFTTDMLEIFFLVDGKKTMAEIDKQLSMEMSEIINYLKKMVHGGIVNIRELS
ncbi:MAG: hypothetical protein PVI90_13960 [Desulfobacteraceae bacterium]|jgi:hypothetical protein